MWSVIAGVLMILGGLVLVVSVFLYKQPDEKYPFARRLGVDSSVIDGVFGLLAIVGGFLFVTIG